MSDVSENLIDGFCPRCGSKSVAKDPSSNIGYDMYVTEEDGFSKEFYDDAIPYKCRDCDEHWYMSRALPSATWI